MLTLAEAKSSRRCRICGEPIAVAGAPAGWPDGAVEMLWPVHVVLNCGAEFAHGKCLGVEPEAMPQPTPAAETIRAARGD